MSTRPRNDSHCSKLCHLSRSLITNNPSKVPNFSCFWTCKILCAEIRKFFTGVSLRMWTPIHVFYFKSGQNRCIISGRKPALYWWQKQTRFGTRRCNPWDDFRRIFVWVRTVIPHVYSGFRPDPLSFGEI